MSDIQIKPEYLPTITPKEVCLMFQQKRTFSFDWNHEIKKDVARDGRCAIAFLTVFNGLFDEVGFKQEMLENAQWADLPDSLMLDKVFDKVVAINGPVRLAIKKYVDENGKYRYAKYVDFDSKKVLELGGEAELRKVIYLLIQACDVDGMLVPNVDESWMNKENICQTLSPLLE